jgi:hypothetical protein
MPPVDGWTSAAGHGKLPYRPPVVRPWPTLPWGVVTTSRSPIVPDAPRVARLVAGLQPHAPALQVLASALDGLEWRLGGSGLLAALGLSDQVGDLDVTVPADALPAVEAALAPWLREVATGPAPDPWCSDWLARAVIEGSEVDVIGGFCLVTGEGRRVAVPQELGGHLDVEGRAIPLADPAVWWWVYVAYKPARADLLAEVVPVERRAQLVRRLGPPTAP